MSWLNRVRVGVIGNGVVGKAIGRSFLEHVEEVRWYDLVPERSTHRIDEVAECDYVFLCLPTPQKEDGSGVDLSPIEKFLSSHAMTLKLGGGVIVLKSTVPIGTTETISEEFGLPIVYSPEFLTARCSLVDAQVPSRHVIGALPLDENGLPEEESPADKLWNLLSCRFQGVETHFLPPKEAEFLKLAQNSFFAVKVAFWNEARTLYDSFSPRGDHGWDQVMIAILSDGRIHPSHTLVPGPDGKRGFGGSCLPKDLLQFTRSFQSPACPHGKGVIASAALYRNKSDREYYHEE